MSYRGGNTPDAEVRGDRAFTQPMVQSDRPGPKTGWHPPFLQRLSPAE